MEGYAARALDPRLQHRAHRHQGPYARPGYSIALEVPSDILGAGPVIGVRATISLRRGGTLVPMDRGGHPTINPFINPDGEKNLYNSRQPADDVANYLGPWSTIVENSGYSPDEARMASP